MTTDAMMITCRYCGAAVRSTAQAWNDHLDICEAYAALPKVPMQPTQLERRRGVGSRPGYPIVIRDELATRHFDKLLAEAKAERLAEITTFEETFGHRRHADVVESVDTPV